MILDPALDFSAETELLLSYARHVTRDSCVCPFTAKVYFN